MSGPKIVRIVTPEERKIIKQKWMIRLKNTIESIREYALQQNVLDEKLEEALNETLSHYESISENEYEKIEREVPNQIEYLNKEKKKLVKKVVKERTSTWSQYTKLKSTHNELRFLLKEKKVAFEDIEQPKIISKDQVAKYQKELDKLHEILKKTILGDDSLTLEQQEIQERLSSGESLLSVQEWGANQPKEISRLKKLEKTLKEMYVDDISQEKIQEFLDRCNDIKQTDANYALLLDSLTIEAANFHKNKLALRAEKASLREAVEQLETIEEEAKILEVWKKLQTSNDLAKVQEAAEKAHQLYEERSQNKIVETRRAAIKKALTEAGYEVNDTMETAWVENGRLVVKKAENSLYGVEFMSPKNLARIQARVVADETRSNERTSSLDKHQEEIWCDEFDDIKEVLSRENLSIHVDKMQEPGVVKLKEVKLDSGFARRTTTQQEKRKLKK